MPRPKDFELPPGFIERIREVADILHTIPKVELSEPAQVPELHVLPEPINLVEEHFDGSL